MRAIFFVFCFLLCSIYGIAQTPQAIWTEGNRTLTFYYGELYGVGEVFNGQKVTQVWSGDHFNEIESTTLKYTYRLVPGWVSEESLFDDTDNTFRCSDFALQIEYAVIDPSFKNYKMTRTRYLFCNCKNMKSITGIENLCTDEIIDMRGMFCDCNSLTSLDVSGFNTKKVKEMSEMFYGCESLTALDVRGFDTENVTGMAYMFTNCKKITELDVSGFDTKYVRSMQYMFYGCELLTALDVSNFDTRYVSDMTKMFRGCNSLTELYIDNFMVDWLTDCEAMFPVDLQTIYCGNNWSKNNYRLSDAKIFEGNSNLVGAVAFDTTKTTVAMANPTSGYFTKDRITIEKNAFDYGLTWAEAGLDPKETCFGKPQTGSFSYLLDGEEVGDKVSEPGDYNLTIRFMSDDGTIDYSQDFEITVKEYYYITADYELDSKNFCGGATAEIRLSNIHNVMPDKYSISFSAAGFKAEEDAVFDGETIFFAIPTSIPSGNYKANFRLRHPKAESEVMEVSFFVGSFALKTKWDDVVYLPNPDNKFVKYQWYRDDEEIHGATKQFYNELGGLNGVYYAVAQDADGNEIQTCPLSKVKQKDLSSPHVNVYPNPAEPGEQITLQLENMDISQGVALLVFTSSGSFVKRIDNAQLTNYLTLPKGGYVGYAVYGGNKIAFKILVEQ